MSMKTKDKILLAIFGILGIGFSVLAIYFFMMNDGYSACLNGLTNQCNIQVSYGSYGLASSIPAIIFLSLGIYFLISKK